MTSQSGYERKGNSSTPKSWSMRFFLLAINVFLFVIILGVEELRIWGFGFLTLVFAILSFNFYRNKKKSGSVVDDNPRDLFPLLKKYLRINRKYLFASIIGLSLALLVISHVIILANSGSSNVYQEVFEDGPIQAFRADTGGYDRMGNPVTNNFSSLRPQIVDTFQDVANEHGLVVDYLQIEYEYRFYLNLSKPSSISDEANEQSIKLGSSSITEQDLEKLHLFPTFPEDITYSENMSLLTYESWFFDQGDVNINDTIAGTSSFNFTSLNYEQEFTMSIDNTWEITDIDEDYASEHQMWGILGKVEQSVVVAQDREIEIFSKFLPSFSYQYMYGYIIFDSLMGRPPEEALVAFEDIESSIEALLHENNLKDGYVVSIAANSISRVQQNEIYIRFVLFLIALPMLGIALYLVYFSLNLVELRKQNLVAIMKVRGISSSQLQVIMTIESLIAGLIAAAIGMIGSVPWSQYILDTSKIYGENAVAYITPEWYWTVPLIAIILTFDLNIGSILSISSTSVEEGEASKENKEPFWRRLYLDVILTVIGVGVWIVVRVVPGARGNPTLLWTALWTLPALALGLPLFISRYYSTFLTILSDILWKREGNIIALATRNMRRNKFSASKLAVLLMIGMMFSFVALSVPHSVTSWSGDRAHYTVGADLRVNNINTINQTQLEIITNRTDISDYSIFHSAKIPANHRSYDQISVLGINSTTFEDAAFWDESYASSSLTKLLEKVKDGKILVLDQALDILSKDIGEDLVLNGDGSDDGNISIIEEIGGSFKYWPNLFHQISFSETWLGDVPVVMSIDNYLNYFNQTTANVYAKLSPNANQTMIHEELSSSFRYHTGPDGRSIDVYSSENYNRQFSRFDEIVLLFSMLDTLLLITILTSFIGVGYFSFTTMTERRREIGVFRAVGMVSRQIFILLVVESVILVASSLLIGILAGSFISSNLFILLGLIIGGVPPIQLRYPMGLTVTFVFVTLLLSIIAATIPARLTASKQTGSILRAE